MTTINKTKRFILISLTSLLTLSLVAVAGVYYILFSPNLKNVEENTYLYIRDNDSFAAVLDQLIEKTDISNTFTLNLVAKQLKYIDNVKPGRYAISDNMTNIELVRKLRSGKQDPLKLQFISMRTNEQLAGRISTQIMADSLSIITLLNDEEFLKQYDKKPVNAFALFIPNTYEVFWDMDAYELFERMKKEYDIFWNESRKEKAAAIPMTQMEVITLASIIQEETNKSFEYPIIAGLYINRLRRNMPLQACPTVKYAVGDFTLRRILNRHLKVDSPYNTYIYPGLPPGPIRTPSTVCIDAVLNYEKHNYLFMTAKETFNGEHNFAATHAEHVRNARRYQRALNANGIR
jgi:UPF0755 protein